MPKNFVLRSKPLLIAMVALLLFNFGLSVLPGNLVAARAQSDPTPTDTSQHGLGRAPDSPGKSAPHPTDNTPVRSNLPSFVDYSRLMPTIGNQGSQGSCVGWATGYYYKTFQEEKKNHWPVNVPTHQFSPAFIYNQINGGVDGGSYPTSAMYLMTTKGADTLADFPYKMTDYTSQPTQAQLNNAALYKAASYDYLYQPWNGKTDAAIAKLREHLANGDLFVIGFPVYHEFDYAQNNNNYIVTHSLSSTENPRGYHEITAVGYDDSRRAFRIVNQWGSGWGNGGYTWMSYDFVRDFALDATAMTNRDELDFTNYPATSPNAPDGVALTFATNRPTTATVSINGATTITTTDFDSSYALKLSGLSFITATAVVTVTDANGEFTSASFAVPPSSLRVTVPTDAGNVSADGTLSRALSLTTAGQFIMFDLPPGQPTVQVSAPLPPLKAGVTLLGSADCSQPTLIDGQDGVDIGLTLSGGNTLQGVAVERFRLKQLDFQGTGNRLVCSRVSKTAT